MRQRDAFFVTMATATARGWNESFGAPLNPAHAEDMLRRWDDSFSEAKAGRWLGWLQGVLCALGFLSIDECKEINRQHSDDSTLPDPGEAPGA